MLPRGGCQVTCNLTTQRPLSPSHLEPKGLWDMPRMWMAPASGPRPHAGAAEREAVVT